MFPWLVQPAAPAPAKPAAPPVFAAPAPAPQQQPQPPPPQHRAPPRPPLRRRAPQAEQPAQPQPQGLDEEGREAVRRLCAVLRRKRTDAPELEAVVAQYTSGLPAAAAAVREVLARPLNPAQRLEALQALTIEVPAAPAAPAAARRRGFGGGAFGGETDDADALAEAEEAAAARVRAMVESCEGADRARVGRVPLSIARFAIRSAGLHCEGSAALEQLIESLEHVASQAIDFRRLEAALLPLEKTTVAEEMARRAAEEGEAAQRRRQLEALEDQLHRHMQKRLGGGGGGGVGGGGGGGGGEGGGGGGGADGGRGALAAQLSRQMQRLARACGAAARARRAERIGQFELKRLCREHLPALPPTANALINGVLRSCTRDELGDVNPDEFLRHLTSHLNEVVVGRNQAR